MMITKRGKLEAFRRSKTKTVILLALTVQVLFSTQALAQAGRPGQKPSPRPTIKITIPQVQTVKPDAAVQITVGQTEISGGGGQQQGGIEGDLAGVALSAVRSHLYARVPEVPVSTRGLAGVTALSTAPASIPGRNEGSSTQTQATWLYDVRIDSFKEYRDVDGRKGTAVDVKLVVWDEEGKSVSSVEYHDPPLAQRKTDEDIQRELRRLEEGRQIMGALKGSFMQPLLDMAEQEALLRKQKITSNYQFSQNPNMLDYQFQEKTVRIAVESLLAQAPMPGERPTTEVATRIEKPRLKREPQARFEEGIILLQQTMFQEAISLWEEMAVDDPAVQYDLGVAYLGQACKMTPNSPAAAYEQVKKAGIFFAKSAKKYNNPALTNATKQLMQNIETHFGGVPTNEMTAARESVGTPATSEIPPLSPIGEKYALLIGIGKFLDSGIPALAAPKGDVRTMSAALMKAGFKGENIVTLIDEQATLKGVRSALEEIGSKVGENSIVVISISTHGSNPATQDAGKEGFIVCHDTNLGELFATAYPVIDFREHVDRRLRCQAKVIFQDTCHSAAGNTRHAGSQIKVTEWSPYMAVFAAADTDQVSIETGGNGIFTSSIAEYLSSATGSITLSQLREHVVDNVPKKAQSHGYTQNPQIFFGPGAESIVLK